MNSNVAHAPPCPPPSPAVFNQKSAHCQISSRKFRHFFYNKINFRC